MRFCAALVMCVSRPRMIPAPKYWLPVSIRLGGWFLQTVFVGICRLGYEASWVMEAILTGYQVSQTAWLYLSSLLIIAVFFRFRRFWSLRNFDLYLLLSLSPGVLLVRTQSGYTLGYAWLFVVTGLCTFRLLFDGLFSKRARIDCNLTSPAVLFLAVCTFAFLITEAITRPAPLGAVSSVIESQKILDAVTRSGKNSRPSVETAAEPVVSEQDQLNAAGPTASLLSMPVMSTSKQLFSGKRQQQSSQIRRFGIVEETAARILAVLAHIAILGALYWIGRVHFQDRSQGVAMAALYLLIPCTSYVVCEVNQVLPCAFILWAFFCYSRPFWSGVLMGFACGSMFFPVFVLPIWASFYGWKKSLRFFSGVGLVALILLGAIALISADSYAFTQQTINRIDFRILSFDGAPNENGFWTSTHPAYRIPVMIAFLLMLVTLTIVPWKKSLEVLLAYSTVVIVTTQFWYPQLGGVYVLWYLPLLILVIFRPRLLAQNDYPVGQTQTSYRTDRVPGLARSTGANAVSAPLYRNP